VKEGHPVTACAWARRAVDELHPFGLERLECGLDVGDPIGHVVETRAPPLEESGHGSVGPQGLQELQASHEDHTHALAGQFLDRGTRCTGQELEEWKGLLQGRRGDGDVVQRKRGHGCRVLGMEVRGGERASEARHPKRKITRYGGRLEGPPSAVLEGRRILNRRLVNG
jgi:hypothetical protein